MEIINKPIEIYSKTLGNLTFRHIYDDDYKFIINCLNEVGDGELFCKKFLINQLINPVLNFDDFNEVNNKEIYSILKEYMEVENLYEYFDFNNSQNNLNIFKEGMENYVDDVNSTVCKMEWLLLESTNLISNNFNFNERISPSLKKINDILTKTASQKNKVLEAVNQSNDFSGIKVFKAVNQTISNENHLFQTIVSSTGEYAKFLNEIISKQKKFWQKWINFNATIYNRITEMFSFFWNTFENNCKTSPLLAQNFLREYNWFISPNMEYYIAYDIIKVYNSSSNHKEKDLNKIFIGYFIDNDCEKLELMVDKWSSNPLFERRIKIIKDCVNFIKNNERGINPSNLVVPTLISQIDGIQKQFMEIHNISIEDKQSNVSNNKKIGQKDYFRHLTVDNEFYDAMNDVFLDILFQSTFPGKNCKSLHFSRHKILHGEIVNYGRKDFMIRCFMILDFLSELDSFFR